MAKSGIKRAYTFDILSEEQVQAIHRATLRVLWETGVAMHDERALKIMAEGGCKVDFDTHRVRIPERLIMDSLAKCPGEWLVKARHPGNDLIIGGPDRTHFCASIGMTTLDLETWIPREPTRKEYCDHIKVLDWLPHNCAMPAFPYFGFAKVPQCLRLVEGHAAKVRISSKAQMEGSVLDNDVWNIAICKATGQEMLHLCNPAAPLTFYEGTISQVLRYTKEDMPFHFASGPVSGATAPATLAGAVVINNADAIAGMVLTQLIKPGHRVWAGSMIMVQNMSTGSPAFGSINNSLMEAMFNQMWRRYEVPNWNTASAWVSSKAIDYQAAYECAMAALSCALSGTSAVLLQGGLTGELTAHPIKAIMDDDIAGMIIRYLEGIQINDETLAVDLIQQVGPIPGHFLTTAHTRKWWKKEQFVPTVADRLTFPEWAAQGMKKAIDHARERMEAILATHKPEPLPPDQEKAVEDILKEARAHYRQMGFISDDDWKLYQEDLASPNYPYA
ncbi:MAG: trimethylamine methyltransferase family protein [Thermodesulfobacteriota bacterium]